MLTEIYIEALLVDEELADQVWKAWDVGEIDDQIACMVWALIAGLRCLLLPIQSLLQAEYVISKRHKIRHSKKTVLVGKDVKDLMAFGP